ncbi:MAG: sugar ABC transporter permease, partial [Propionibacteriaceae bacterium]|nr:sugar ABC transporter permease [Propionibacteriaceae bacterium]
TMYLYELGWNTQRNLGRSAAVAWLLFLIIVIFALINYAITQRISTTDARPMRKVLVKK